MKITPALEYEKIRQDAESWNKVILHREGKFYRAYEWSAWIIKTADITPLYRRADINAVGDHPELLENELTLKFGYFDRDMKVYTLKNT